MARRALLALALASTVAPAAAAAASPQAPPGFGSAGRWITYPDGRVFIPHGFNLIATRAPYYPASFGADDARLLASEGFTAVRLLFMPAALEPSPGTFDAAYLQQFVDRVALLGRYGIATMLALDQDGYAEACGGDGFPAWMIVGTCDDDLWGPFWANAETDGRGLQDHYLDWWSYVMSRLAGSPTLLGFDLLNEPVAPDAATLGAFWSRTVAALAPQTSRLVFTEPGAPGSPAFGAVVPAGTGYETHLYCWATLQHAFAGKLPSRAEIAQCIPNVLARLRQELGFAARNGYPFVAGEFGASDELQEQTRLVDALGESFVPWTVYAYNSRLDSSGTPTQSILRDESKAASVANAKAAKLAALVVPYPVAVAGTPSSWRFDRARRVVRFHYSTRPVGRPLQGHRPTVVFIPRRVYPSGYAVTASGATVISPATSPWLRLRTAPGARQVAVTIRPTTGSTTRTPLQAGLCGYDLRPCGSR